MREWQAIKDYLIMIAGSAVIAASFNMFLIPNRIAAGGIGGLGVVFFYLLSLPVGVTILLLNLPLFALAAKIFGLRFVGRGILGAVSLAFMVEFLSFLPVITQDVLLATLYGGVIMGVGVALVFRARGSTGGTVMAAQLLNRFTGLPMGQGLLLVDFFVVSAAGLVFNLELAMYALVAIFLTSRVIDLVQEGIGTSKAALIISDRPQEILLRLLREVDRGATLLSGKGGYTGKEKEMILTVVTQAQVHRLKAIIHETDEKAFIIVGNVHEVMGEGFKKSNM